MIARRPSWTLATVGLAWALGWGLACGQTDASVARTAIAPGAHAGVAASRGQMLFSRYCMTCHGPNADGNGRAARLYTPKPANLRQSDKNDAYMALIVRMGGAAMGRSDAMPPWRDELSSDQVADLVSYLRSINLNPSGESP